MGNCADHDGEGGAPLSNDLVSLVGQIGNANRRGTLRSSRGHLSNGYNRVGVKNLCLRVGVRAAKAATSAIVRRCRAARRRWEWCFWAVGGRNSESGACASGSQGNLPVKFPDQCS